MSELKQKYINLSKIIFLLLNNNKLQMHFQYAFHICAFIQTVDIYTKNLPYIDD